MNASLNQGSAKIYQFPVGGRAALGGRRYDEFTNPRELLPVRVIETVAASSGWYHEAAIRESKPVREC